MVPCIGATAKRILACVSERPGANQSTLARELGVAHKTVEHHLRRLTRKDLVRIHRVGGRLAIFPRGVSLQAAAGAVALQGQCVPKVMDLLRQRGCIAINEAAETLGVSRKVARRALRALLSAGLTTRAPGRRGFFFLTEGRAPPTPARFWDTSKPLAVGVA